MRSLLLLPLLFLTFSITLVQARVFSDIPSHEHSEYVEVLQSHGIVEGYPDGTFRPDNGINRAEFLKILLLSAFGSESVSAGGNCFADFSGEEQWFWRHACAAKERGIISGYPDGAFRGERNVNLAEALKMVIEAWSIRTPSYPGGPPDWYDPYFDIAAAKNIFSVLPYEPGHLVTRGEMAALIILLGQKVHVTGNSGSIVFGEQSGPAAENNVCGNGSVEGNEQCDDGDNADGDGCSSICVIVPETLRHSVMRVQQLPVGSLDQSAGSKDVVLAAFEAAAGRQDAILTGIKFRSVSGSLLYARNYRLYADMSGNGKAQTQAGSASPQGEVLSFSDLNVQIRQGVMRRFELRADLTVPAGRSALSVGFDAADPQYITAVGSDDGRELTGITTDAGECARSVCWIAVYTLDSAGTVEILDKGNLFVTSDAVPLRSRQVRVGELSYELFSLRFRADGEDIKIEDLAIAGGNEYIEYLDLYENESNVQFARARSLTCSTPTYGVFCSKPDLVIGSGEEKSVIVRAYVRQDSADEASGESFALYLTTGVVPQPAIEARGISSNSVLAQNDGDRNAEGEVFIGASSAGASTTVAGQVHDIVASNIVSISNAGGESDVSGIPLGDVTVGAFSFAASGKSGIESYPVRLKNIQFSVLADNVRVDQDSFRLFNAHDPDETKDCSASGGTGDITVTCSDLETSSVSATIDQGSSITLSLEADVTDANIMSGRSALQAGIRNLGRRSGGGTVEWDDGRTTFDWIDVEDNRVESVRYHNE